MPKLLTTALASSILVLAGCGGEDGGGSAGCAAGAADVAVCMKSIKFQPKDITIKVGDTVRWVNEDSVAHDAVAKSGDLPKSELFGKGQSYEATFGTAGKIDYVCTVHPGMEGTITVQ